MNPPDCEEMEVGSWKWQNAKKIKKFCHFGEKYQFCTTNDLNLHLIVLMLQSVIVCEWLIRSNTFIDARGA